MFYRENGQFKSTYASDQQMLPILQDRVFMPGCWIRLRRRAVLVSDYCFLSLLIPFLILTAAAIGLNLLVGYCGQISIGHAAFMAVGAYAAYNLVLRVPQLNFLVVLVLAGLIAAAVGILFGIPSLRIKGLYLAVATLAAQFFMDWLFARVKWFTNYRHSGSVSTAPIEMFGWTVDTPAEKYLFLLGVLIVFTLVAKNLVRSHIGREWMAMRDMDVAAEVIGIRPVYAKLTAFAVQRVLLRRGGRAVGIRHLGAWEPLAFNLTLSLNLLFMIIIGGMGSLLGSFSARRSSSPCRSSWTRSRSGLGVPMSTAMASHLASMIFGALIVFFLIVEPHGLARLWAIGKEKLRLWPFPH
jgi:branched-chain amino acid transport system permease protein